MQGSPAASAGDPPTVNGQIVTWTGTVTAGERVSITFTTRLTSTTTTTPTMVNEATIDDGMGNVYTRRAYINGYRTLLPAIFRAWTSLCPSRPFFWTTL